jgi:hypothetical protein
MRSSRSRINWSIGFISLTLLALAQSSGAERPQGYKQILPRGRLASIDDPVYVSARSARIPDRAWVLGLVIDGQAFAYSLNLLNTHEVVNDEASGQPFAAVW